MNETLQKKCVKNMITFSLENPEVFYRIKENSNKHSYGCEQEWYLSERQKKSGCGPTTACNLLSYMEFSRLDKEKISALSKDDGLLRMQESWEYVTPTEKGIPTIKMFCENFLFYAKVKNMNILCHSIDVSEKTNTRPEFHDVVEFIKEAMIENSPVAFLNLCNGEVDNLDEWHWVTIISIEYDEGETQANVNIIDEGRIKKIDLKLWNDTTALGGGFVYFTSVS